ncbi:hypothetical protein [Cytobacillus dafuensis]|uniref:Uncharacterized protein n=1 Tax=Cytobacillus dafuensis TaxID=1742359 RepID=A0A5B8Z7C6_CYTDA|nr:hypothetical protein [Cytobacillus dafuensis]QED47286.1 hypothetical protein FSZ17_08530 [Cytobacillus dafuensis]
MKWGSFLATAFIILIIILLQWPKMKPKPKVEKSAFIVLLLIALLLSMFNLPYISGPAKWIEYVFKPFGEILEK